MTHERFSEPPANTCDAGSQSTIALGYAAQPKTRAIINRLRIRRTIAKVLAALSAVIFLTGCVAVGWLILAPVDPKDLASHGGMFADESTVVFFRTVFLAGIWIYAYPLYVAIALLLYVANLVALPMLLLFVRRMRLRIEELTQPEDWT